MSTLDIVRAWKDEEYWQSLSDTQRASLPQNPAGIVELTDDQLRAAGGGEENSTIILSITLPICPMISEEHRPSLVTLPGISRRA